MFRRLAQALGRNVKAAVQSELAVPERLAVVGDIHGRADLLGRLLDRLAGQGRIVLVGDYIDRGERSREVIDMAMSSPGLTCLQGNHEAMCLGFLDDPARHGARWMRNGGLQTLASFGVPGSPNPEDFCRMRDALALAMGDDRIKWLRDRPLSHSVGNLFICHAGADPARPVAAQDRRTLLWGHRHFPDTPRSDGFWIAHGHVIVDEPVGHDGRIAVDTGAYATGRLTAALVEGSRVRFLST